MDSAKPRTGRIDWQGNHYGCELKKIIEGYQLYCKQEGLKDSPDLDNEPPLSQEDIKKLKSLGYL